MLANEHFKDDFFFPFWFQVLKAAACVLHSSPLRTVHMARKLHYPEIQEVEANEEKNGRLGALLCNKTKSMC